MIFHPSSAVSDDPTTPVVIPHHQDRLLKAVLIGTFIVILLCAGIAWVSSQSRDDTSTIRNGTDLQGCRALYSSSVTAANSDAIVIVLQGLSRVTKGQQLDDLIVANNHAQKRIHDATTTYRAAVKLSVSDPQKFLANCRTRTP